MLEKISNSIYKFFNVEQVIDKEKQDLYKYGIQIFLSNITEIFLAVLIGVIFSSVVEILILLCSFIITRRFTGGYHAKTFARCSFLTSCVMLLSILMQKYICISFNMCIFISIISLILFIVFVPIENENKKLDDSQKHKCKTNAIIALLLQFIIGYMLYRLNISFYSIIFISLFFVYFLILISIKRKEENKNEKDYVKSSC